MAKPMPEFPKRLLEGDDALAKLVRTSLGEPLGGPSEAKSWERLRERRAPNPLRWGLVFAAGAACMLGLIWSLHGVDPNPALSVRPEVLTGTKPTNHAATATSQPATETAQNQPIASARAVPVKPEAETHPLEAASDPARCASLAREEHYEAAADCYDRIARGHSMAAELALYEKARLESKALGRGAAALQTLDEYARRFPGGVLGAEVGMTRIELLIRLGQGDAALAAIERALAGSLGHEHGGDLEAMRGDLLATRGDCAAALEALARARKAGVHPSRLEAGEKRCAHALDAVNEPSPRGTNP